jgi:hypothetical protein
LHAQVNARFKQARAQLAHLKLNHLALVRAKVAKKHPLLIATRPLFKQRKVLFGWLDQPKYLQGNTQSESGLVKTQGLASNHLGSFEHVVPNT